jgi:HK97 family phage portal protein
MAVAAKKKTARAQAQHGRAHAAVTQKRVAMPHFPSTDKAFFQAPRFKANDIFDHPYSVHSWTYALIRALATNIAKVPLVVKTGTRQDPRNVEIGSPGYEWQELFDHPNPNLSATEFIEAQVTWLSLSGECINVKVARGGGRVGPYDVPAELWPYSGKVFSHLIDKKSKAITGWSYYDRDINQTVPYLAHEVCQIKYLNPYYPARGLAPMEAAKMALGSDYRAAEFNQWFFENDASAGVVLVTPGDLDQDQVNSILESWSEEHQGPQRRRKPAVMKGGMSIQELGTTHREMEFVKLREFSLKELCAIFKVPDSEISNYQNLNYATASSVKIEFWTATLIPIMKMIEAALYSRLMLGPGQGKYWVEFDLSQVEALAEDDLSKLTAAKQAIDLGVPFNEVNERFQLGYEKQDGWGDAPLLPADRTDARLYDLPPDEQPEPEPAVPAIPAEPAPPPAKGEEEPAEETDEEEPEAEAVEESSTPGLTPDEEAHATAWLATLNRSKSSKWFDHLKQVLAPGEKKFLSKYRNYLFKLRSWQLAKLAEATKGGDIAMVRASPGDVVFPRREWDQKLKAMERPVYAEVTLNANNALSKELGGTFKFDVTDPKIVQAMERREAILAQTNGPLYDRIMHSLQKGSAAGESPADLAMRIKMDFNFQASRSVTIARTEVASSVSTVRYEGMGAEGVQKHEWITARDESVRPSHSEQEGQVVAMGEAFENGLLYPCDPTGEPEETINCRCLALPVIE